MFLKDKSKTFAWKHDDMIGIDKNIITHKLNIDPYFTHIHQKIKKVYTRKKLDHTSRSRKTPQNRDDQGSQFPNMASQLVVVKKNG